MSNTYAVVCGSLNMDLVCTTPRIPKPGETILGRDFFVKEGGKGANQATALSRLGLHTKMIGCVGNDNYGDTLLASLARNGVDVSFIKRVSGATGTAHITVDDDGENNIVVVQSANAKLTKEQVLECEEMISKAYAAIVQLEIPLSTAEEFMRIAKRNGVMTVLNPAPMPTDGLSDATLSLVDLLTPNETEMEQLTGIAVKCEDSFTKAAQALHKRGVRRVVCTLGAKGAFYSGEEGVLFQSSVAVVPVDATCAGDSFTGALTVKLSEGASIADALAFAAKAASITVTKLGAQESLPYREEVGN